MSATTRVTAADDVVDLALESWGRGAEVHETARALRRAPRRLRRSRRILTFVQEGAARREDAAYQQDPPYWDRLLIRLPGYSFVAWLGSYGFHQDSGWPMRDVVLMWLLATSALSAYQGWKVWRSPRRRRSGRRG